MKTNLLTTYDLIKATDANGGELPQEIELLPAGKWQTTKYPEPIEITEQIMDKMIANFKAGHRAGVPIDTDHDEGKANGWINDIYKKTTEKGLRLMGKVDWNSLGKQQLSDKIFRFISPEFHFNFTKPLTGEKIGPTLLAATVTNRPLFNILKPIVANEGLTDNKTDDTLEIYITANDNTMNLDEILKKPAKDRTPEEKKFLSDAKDKLSEAQKKQMSEETDAETKEKADADRATADAEKDKADAEKAKAEGTTTTKTTIDTKTEGSEKTITIKASEWEAVKTAQEETSKKLKFTELSQDFEKTYQFNDKGGKILPKGKDAFIKLMYSLSDEQVKLFNEVMTAVPDKKLFSEIGANKKDDGILTAGEKFEKLIDEKLKANKDMEYLQASEAVTKENPELWTEYNSELTGGAN